MLFPRLWPLLLHKVVSYNRKRCSDLSINYKDRALIESQGNTPWHRDTTRRKGEDTKSQRKNPALPYFQRKYHLVTFEDAPAKVSIRDLKHTYAEPLGNQESCSWG